MSGETISPIEAQMDDFHKKTVDVLTWLTRTYEDEEMGPLLDNTVVPLEPAALMQTYAMMEGDAEDEESTSKTATWEADDERHFQDLTAVEQGLLVGTACRMLGTSVENMKQHEVDAATVNVVNPDAMEDGADEKYPTDPSTAITEEHYYQTGKEGTYMSKYVYADGAVVWGIARSTVSV